MERSKVPLKRLFSATIDFCTAFLPTWIITKVYLSTFDESLFALVLLINLLIINLVIPLIGSGRTVGDVFTKIEMVSLSEGPPGKPLLLGRNFTYCLILSGIMSLMSDLFSIVLITVSVLSSYLMMFSNKNKFNEYLSALDFVFKTKFKNVSVLDRNVMSR